MSSCSRNVQPMTSLAEKGQAVAVIVLPDEPIPSELTAAKELSAYLHKATGAEFKVVKENAAPEKNRIFIGPSRTAIRMLGDKQFAALGSEDFIVRAAGGDLLLVGGRPRGSLYAVYSFLEKEVGCRWFNWYGDEYVPQRKDLKLADLYRRDSPAMAVRDIIVHSTLNVTEPERLRDFLVRNRCQGPEFTFFEPRGLDLNLYGGMAHRQIMPPWMAHTTFTLLCAGYKTVSPASLPIGKILEQHPEYFSMIAGKRVMKQPCFSNSQVRKLVTEGVLQRLEEVGGKGIISVSLEDSSESCECPECLAMKEREGPRGASMFDYMAELGGIVKKKYPEAYLSTHAYFSTYEAPKHICFPSNVVVIYAPLGASYYVPLEHPSNKKFKEHLQGWSEKIKAGGLNHLWVWYYPNKYDTPLPCGNLDRLAKDFRLFKKLGVNGYFIEQDAQGTRDSQRLVDLQTWLMAKLMWDPEQDLAALIDDFTTHYYGAAAPYIREYIFELETATAALPSSYDFLTGDRLISFQETFDRAEEAAWGNAELLLRVRQLRMSVDFACMSFWDRLRQSGEVPFNFDELFSRYHETYTRTVNVRTPKAGREKKLADLQAFLAALTPDIISDSKPQPPDEVEPGRIRKLTPEAAGKERGVRWVEDKAAAGGRAVTLESDKQQPFFMGFYDWVTGKERSKLLPADSIKLGKYHLYYVTRARLSGKCWVFFDRTWRVNFPGLGDFFDQANPGQQWDFWASIRFEGPAYDKNAAQDQTNRFFVDQVILVKVKLN